MCHKVMPLSARCVVDIFYCNKDVIIGYLVYVDAGIYRALYNKSCASITSRSGLLKDSEDRYIARFM